MQAIASVKNRFDIANEDYHKFYVAKPDPNFSVAHNQAVIERTIKKNEEYARKRAKLKQEQLSERVEKVSGYIRHLVNKNDSTPIESYLGKKYMMELQAQRILEQCNYLTGREARMKGIHGS